jgi:hypothetical protein
MTAFSIGDARRKSHLRATCTIGNAMCARPAFKCARVRHRRLLGFSPNLYDLVSLFSTNVVVGGTRHDKKSGISLAPI